MQPRRAALWFAAAFWTLFGAVTGIQVWISMITHGHSIPVLVGYFILVWVAWVIPTALVFRLDRRFPLIPLRRVSVLMHILLANVIAVLHMGYSLALMVVMRPYDRMTAGLAEIPIARILFSRMPEEWICYCFVLGAVLAVDFYERFRERELQAVQLEASLADARLHALELQLQPHFLFNTMNAITSLVRNRRNDEAVTMMAGLSELLRYTLDHAGEQHVALEDELAILRRYLEIQHSRFPDRMTFSIDLSPDARRAAIPTLLLQPLAENAVRHGISMSAAPGVVEVRAFRSDGRLRIEVFNSGALATSSDRGVGLRNTRDRLRHLYGDDARFDLASADGGVVASVSIPWSEVA